MHLLVPFASAVSEACAYVLRDLALPHLERLLARLEATVAARDTADAASLSPPHERAVARGFGWHGDDGALPFAARAARRDGIDVGDLAWGLVSPVHWQLGRDRVTLADPAELQLDEADSRRFFDAVGELFESEGFTIGWGAADRWYAAHDELQALPTASLDRAVGHDVERWLRRADAARPIVPLLGRLQSEAQLLLYEHAANEARARRGLPAINSFWLSGCGRHQAADEAHAPEIDASLRAPMLAGDWAAWAEAWRALDAGRIAALLAAAESGESVALTLCGERTAATWGPATRPLWQRLRGRFAAPAAHASLQAL